MNLPNNFQNFIKHLGFTINDFKPICYFDEVANDLVFQLEDCSFKESYCKGYSYLIKNHSNKGNELIGLRIYNIKQVYREYLTCVGDFNLAKVLQLILEDNLLNMDDKVDFINRCKGLEFPYADIIRG